jgi:Domain of unknown function (DUF5658)
LALASLCLLTGCATLASKPVFVGCQTADTATTLEGMKQGARELNPIIAGIFTAFGPAGFVALKAGVTLVVLHYHAMVSSGVLAAADVITCGAAVHNARVLAKLGEKRPD